MFEGLLVLALDNCSDFAGISDMSKTSSINHRKYFKKILSVDMHLHRVSSLKGVAT